MDAPKQRTSLAIQIDIGLELLSIYQSVTADGQLGDEEAHALNN